MSVALSILVDTNALLHGLLTPAKLSARARNTLADRKNELVWSTASTWEIVIKARLGKLDLGGDVAKVLGTELVRLGMRVLPIEQAHCLRIAGLPDVDWKDAKGVSQRHADPFDRLLIAQALVEGLPILSADGLFERYGVRRVW